MAISTDRIERLRKHISRNWDSTVLKTKGKAEATNPLGGNGKEIALPYPFTVPTPGNTFRMFFYWDTYFTSEGLVRDNRLELAKNNADNMLYLIDAIGYVPNYTLKGHLNRSQPPVASTQVRLIYERIHDKKWLAQAHATLEKEYAFWMAFRSGPDSLNRYGHHADPGGVKEFYDIVKDRFVKFPENAAEKLKFLSHAMAEAESGWDFNPRFESRCLDFYPIDLNSLLYMHELNAAYFCRELGNGQEKIWQERAKKRKALASKLCWNEKTGFFYDYDFINRRHSKIKSAAAFFALWSGIASKEQAKTMVKNLSKFEKDFGILTCLPGKRANGQVYQWDAPNSWPPLVFALIAGLKRYGYGPDVKRIALKYVSSVVQTFETTGELWEKYNALTGGADVKDEYKMPSMMGWTAGTFLYALEQLKIES